jgi:hypothetical protein
MFKCYGLWLRAVLYEATKVSEERYYCLHFDERAPRLEQFCLLGCDAVQRNLISKPSGQKQA